MAATTYRLASTDFQPGSLIVTPSTCGRGDMQLAPKRRRRGKLVAAVCVVLASLTPPSRGLAGEPAQSRSVGEPAWVVAASLPTLGGTWTELTTLPYDLEDPKYRAEDHDQWFPGSGVGFAGGRIQALAVDGDTVYAGAASGGVWRSLDRGKTWTPVTDNLPSLSSGDLAIDPSSGDIWYATGEAAGYSKIYRGVGVFRSTDGGDTWELVGGDELDQTLIGTLEFDGIGNVYAATSHGLFRRSTSAPPSQPWTLVLRPGMPGPYGFTFANDVVVRPGTEGRVVVASFGWREGEVDHNGFYLSRGFGLEGTWERLALHGELDREEIGRASLAYSSDGTRLYALVQSWRYFTEGRSSTLYGVFMSPGGNPRGSWRKIAGVRRLKYAPGSFAAINPAFGVGGHNGVQAIGVDPADRDHLYVGLEALYETTDAGRSWITAAPDYCGVGTFDLCRTTTHGDHHAIAFSNGIVYSGNDGGVYRRPVSRHTVGGWVNLNRDLHALQFYAVGVGNNGAGDVFWGGIQDNGVSLLRPGASRMVAPHCCEAFSLIVDPSNPDRAVLVHVDFAVTITTNGGLAKGFRGAGPPDPRPSIFNMLRADPQHPNRHWVFGGRYLWETTRGWRTTRSDWTRVDDPGRDRMVSALDVSGDTIYVGWCGPVSCDPHPEFATGIDTNVGGQWHRVVGPEIVNEGDPLPNRWISSLRVDPVDPLHVYAVYGEYRRPWTAEPRPDGHVFESTDGGESWTDISGNLPGAPATDLLILGDKLVVSMDVGVFVADAANPTVWLELGTGIPNVVVNSLTLTPNGGSIVAATYGRGLWTIKAP
jgi:hypothetical protein